MSRKLPHWNDFLVATTQPDEVSSTKVRALIDAGNWDELARPDMLGPAESACLKERHEAGQLYFE